MHNPRHGALPENTSEFVKTHCATCAAGWMRATDKGEILIVCLLDRQAVWAAMTHCNRYEPEELRPPVADPQPDQRRATAPLDPWQPGYLPPGQPRGK